MVRCDGLTERVTDYLERQLSLSERLEIYLHLCRCRDCRTYLDQMKRTKRLLGRLPAPRCSAEASDELLARFRSSRPSTPSAGPPGGALYLLGDRGTVSARAAVKDAP